MTGTCGAAYFKPVGWNQHGSWGSPLCCGLGAFHAGRHVCFCSWVESPPRVENKS